jgi:peptide/nickel transport system substrate-binding protein
MRLTGKRRSGRGRRALAAGCAVTGLALLAAACGPAGSDSATVGTTPVSGGVATYATLPGLGASFIFPFETSTYFTATNTDNFQYLLYRPLYWFGQGTTPDLNRQISLADPPAYKNQTVTITLKPNRWSDGSAVTAQDVLFWIHLTQAEDTPALVAAGKNGWAGFIPGYFPDNVTDVKALSSTELQMTIKGPYSETWFTDNELSQITPLPKAWDETAPGHPSNCEQVLADCAAVYNYLTSSKVGAANPADWNSALWRVVDGPWQVSSAQNLGSNGALVKMTYNASYTGPAAAHHVSQFELLPFASEQAEFNQLEDPQGNPIDLGYLPTVDAPVPPAGAQVGSNPVSLSNYKLTVIYPWELSYFPYNFSDKTAGPIFHQLYFREAFQSLVDQEGVINGPMHGYGKPTIGPVASYPTTSNLSPHLAQVGDQWPLNPSYAESLLRAHGWSFDPGGADVCQHPALCGPGVKAGAKLEFNLIYALGLDWMDSAIKELVSNATLVGIKINEQAVSTNTVIGDVFAGAGPWQLADWGSWTYAPDYLPTGEELFETTSGDNGGHYSNGQNNTDIVETLAARSPVAFDKAMYTWEDFLAKQLPVVWSPNVATLDESVDNLFIGPQSPTLSINPEDWYYLK